MTEPALDHGDVRIWLGDALEQLAHLETSSVQCIVTSPPFWALRDYGTATWRGGDETCDHLGPPMRTKANLANSVTSTRGGATHIDREPMPGDCPLCGAERVDQQIGLEATPEQWAANLVAVMREARRVLRPDGVAWLEVGDTYASSGGSQTPDRKAHQAPITRPPVVRNVKPKDLVGAPWLLAFALRADGWWLRSDVIWARPNPMPESVTDRPTKAHSYVFLLSASERYYYDADAIREQALQPLGESKLTGAQTHAHAGAYPNTGTLGSNQGAAGRNARSVWTITTEPSSVEHYATMPTALAARCIRAGTSEHGCCAECSAPWRRITETSAEPKDKQTGKPWLAGGEGIVLGRATEPNSGLGRDHYTRSITTGWEPSCEHEADRAPCTVLDPFMGSGTTALVARELGRRAVGVELSAEYLEIASKRLAQMGLLT